MNVMTDSTFSHFSFVCHRCGKKIFSPFDVVLMVADDDEKQQPILAMLRVPCQHEHLREAARLGSDRYHGGELLTFARGLLKLVAGPHAIEQEEGGQDTSDEEPPRRLRGSRGRRAPEQENEGPPEAA